jgi:hypothetical protein
VIIAGADEPASGGRPLEVTVTNVGGTSAQNVIVEVTVGDVTREVDLDLVAKGERNKRQSWFPSTPQARPMPSRELHEPVSASHGSHPGERNVAGQQSWKALRTRTCPAIPAASRR